jgi:hypothetical protein
MKIIGNEPAMPTIEHDGQGGTIQGFGLTKREYFAALAIQGWLAGYPNYEPDPHYAAKRAVEIADALIQTLNEEVSNE